MPRALALGRALPFDGAGAPTLLDLVVVATQNPMDLDYRALSHAGMWFVGRLQTDAVRAAR